MAKSTASTPTASSQSAGVGNQHSAQTPSFVLPNVGCAAQCIFSSNYNQCYNACASGPSVVVLPGGGSANPVSSVNVSSSKPVVSPGTNKTTTSGTAVEPTGTPQTGGAYSTTSTSGTPTSTAASTSPFGTTSWQDFGIRAGLVVGGSILVIVGVIKIFSGQPVIQQVPGTLSRRPPSAPRPIVTRRSFVETREVGHGGSAQPAPSQTPAQSAAQARVDATQGAPMAAPAPAAPKGPRKYTKQQVGAIKAKQRTHIANARTP